MRKKLKMLFIIILLQVFVVNTYASTKNHCDIYLNRESYYDFKDLEKVWMAYVTHRLNQLIQIQLNQKKIKKESDIYELISKKSGILPANVSSHFKGRLLANLKFANAAAEVFEVSVDYILAKDFFELFFERNFVIQEYHFFKRYHFVLRQVMNYLFWSREQKIMTDKEFRACLKTCPTELLLDELRRRGLYTPLNEVEGN